MHFLASIALSGFLLGSVTYASTSQGQSQKLTVEEQKIASENRSFFNKLVGGLKSDLYRVRAQNFSSFNLDLQAFIHFKRSPITGLNQKETFSLASDGNQIIHGVPVWPIQGTIEYYSMETFKFQNEVVKLRPVSGVFYLLESEQAHSERLKRWEKLKERVAYEDYVRATGRIIGVVQMDLSRVSIEMFQINSETRELVPAGVITGVPVR